MSVLPTGRSLRQVVPELEELLLDPARYLQSGVVAIGPRKMFGLAALFGLAGIAILLSLLVTTKNDVADRIAVGVGLLVGSLIWLSWSLMMRGHQLVLHPDGVEVKYRDTVVWCPWALFNADGEVYVPQSDSPQVGLTLPVATEAIPYVELRRDDTPIAHGAQVKCRQLLFAPDSQVVLPARYDVMAQELGELLLQLGRRLGRQLPRGSPPPEAYQRDELDDVQSVEPDPAGWITVHLTRLRWPPVCAQCGRPTNDAVRVQVLARTDRFFSIFGQNMRYLELAVPVCESCHEEMRQRQHRGGRNGMMAGTMILLGGVLLVLLFRQPLPLNLLLLPILLTAAVGGLVGFMIGAAASRQLPVQFRNYSPARGTVSLRFRNPEHAAPLLAALRNRKPAPR